MVDELQPISRQMGLTGTKIAGTGNAIEPFRYTRFDHTYNTVKDWR